MAMHECTQKPCMSAHKNYVLLDLDLRKFKDHKENAND